MGMYDIIEIHESHGLPDTNGWQTKDTPMQYLDRYKIDENGNLFHQIYDTKDRSDPNATGLAALVGCMTRVNKRWVKIEFRGEICFYTDMNGEWYEYSALFDKGKMLSIERIVEVE